MRGALALLLLVGCGEVEPTTLLSVCAYYVTADGLEDAGCTSCALSQAWPPIFDDCKAAP